jgi:hypothetical protein
MATQIQKQLVGEVANDRGTRGEHMAELALTSFDTFPAALFRIARLGEKWPTTDFYAELKRVNGVPAALFQIKTPMTGLQPGQTELRLTSPKRDVLRLSKNPMPAYLLGVCHDTKRVFVRAIPKNLRRGINSIPTTHELTEPNVKVLHDEIEAFWASQPPANINSNFP